MRMKNGLSVVALVAGFGLGLASAQAEMVLKRGNSGDPETLDPQKTSTVYEAHILRDLFEGLMARTADGTLINGAAESFKVSADGKTYTFKLKANLKWSDGTPVTAEDFVYSYRRMMQADTGSQYANLLFMINNAEDVNGGKKKPEEMGVKAVDATTLEFTLNNPTPYFVEMLAHQSSFPVPRHVIAKFGNDWIKPENMVTNGAFKLTENVPHDHITMVKSPTYYGAGAVKLDKVIYYPTEDRSAALRRFQANELDLNDDIPTDQLKFIREKLKDEFKTSPYLGTYYFPFNTTKAPFNDVRVRNALSLAVDREFLAEEIWGGTMLPGYSLVPPGTGTYGTPSFSSFKDMSPAQREDKAKELLKAAGYGPGGKPLKVEIRYNTSENHKKTSVALADMWKPFNVEVSLVNTDVKTHYAFLRDRKNEFDVARAGWIADYNDPQNFLFLLQTETKSLNYARYSNPDYDKLMDQAGAEADLVKRVSILKDVEKIAMRDEPYMVLLTYASKNLVAKRVKGWAANTLDEHRSQYMSVE